MKKALLLMTVAALIATPAFAGIRNTKHDLSSTSTAATKSNNYNEICVFCHTPHGGVTTLQAPLWNRSAGLPAALSAATDLYNSATLTSGVSTPTAVATAVNASDARLCLSCHNGSSLGSALANPANSASGAQPAGLNNITGNANLGSTLTNDHPIGMVYASATPSSEFNSQTGSGATATVGGLPLYTASAVMWCSSCHDVHDNTKGTPFLNSTNAASALCLKCHVK